MSVEDANSGQLVNRRIVDQVEELLSKRDWIGAKRLCKVYLVDGRPNNQVMYLLSIAEAELGNIEVALDTLSAVVSEEPDHLEARYTMAKLLMDTSRHRDAMSHHDFLVARMPTQPWIMINRGISRVALGDLPGATVDFDRAIQLDPTLAPAFLNKGSAMLERGLAQEALACFEKALQLDPLSVEALSNKALSLLRLQSPTDALVEISKAIAIQPHSPQAWNIHGNVLTSLGRSREALDSFRRATVLNSNFSEAWNNLGNAQVELGDFKEALLSFERAISLNTHYAEAWNNRGIAFRQLGEAMDALASYDRAIAEKPNYSDAWSNRGIVLNHLNEQQQALASYDRALELNPQMVEAWSNRGVVLASMNRFDEAGASYCKALDMNPEHASAHYNRALMDLTMKDFSRGFKGYLWRWKVKDFKSRRLSIGLPLCDRKSSNQRILLWPEQGLGDEVFYSGMLTQAGEVFKEVTLLADKRLVPVFQRSFPKFNFLDSKQDVPYFAIEGSDSQAPIGNLGTILGLERGQIQRSRAPFLVPNLERMKEYRKLMPFLDGRKLCGVSWRSQNETFGHHKSVNITDLVSVLKHEGVELVNLQYGSVDAELTHVEESLGIRVHRMPGVDLFNDIEGLLALIALCDFVVTASNVTAHLAGAIGQRGCVLVPFARGRLWYWHLDDSSSFWYPSLRLFYQKDPLSWASTLRSASDWASGMLRERHGGCQSH